MPKIVRFWWKFDVVITKIILLVFFPRHGIVAHSYRDQRQTQKFDSAGSVYFFSSIPFWRVSPSLPISYKFFPSHLVLSSQRVWECCKPRLPHHGSMRNPLPGCKSNFGISSDDLSYGNWNSVGLCRYSDT